MKPVLFAKNATNFNNNGFGTLSDCISCTVTEERNGMYELEMEYPVTGIHFSEIEQGSLIKCRPYDGSTPQAFEVYEITKPANGICTVLACHISYRLRYVPCEPFTASSASEAVAAIGSHALESCPFTFWTNIATIANYRQTTPASIRSRLGGVSGSILDVYGGEYEWDNFNVKLHRSRGNDQGVTLRYGKNITDIQSDESVESMANGVCPFWHGTVRDASGNESDVLVTLPEHVLHLSGSESGPYQRTVPLDLSGDFQDPPTVAQLRSKAQAYMNANMSGTPKTSINVSFVALWQTEEYKDVAALERVRLCDTVTVYFEKLGISTSTKVVKTVYNVLLERYDSIELGEAKSNFAASMASVADSASAAGNAAANAANRATVATYSANAAETTAVNAASTAAGAVTTANNAASTAAGAVATANTANDKATLAGNTANTAAERAAAAVTTAQNALDEADAAVAAAAAASATAQSIASTIDSRIQTKIDNATELLTGADGGYVVIKQNADGEPQEILIMDNQDASRATNVLRLNRNGLGFSRNGINGPYANAWTIDGNLSASYITTGTLDAAQVNVVNINASKINTGTLNAANVAVINLSASNITSGTLNANLVNVINLNAGSITTGTLDASQVNVVNMNANNITAGAIDASVIAVTNLSASNITTGILNVRNSNTGYYTKIDTGTGKLEWNSQYSSMNANGTLTATNVNLQGAFKSIGTSGSGSSFVGLVINSGDIYFDPPNGTPTIGAGTRIRGDGNNGLTVFANGGTINIRTYLSRTNYCNIDLVPGDLPTFSCGTYRGYTMTVYGLEFRNGLFVYGRDGGEAPDLSGATRTLFSNAGINMVIKDGIVKSCNAGNVRTSGSFTVSGTTYYIRDGLICTS